MNQSDYIQANRSMWNKTADVHEGIKMQDLLTAVKDPRFNIFDDIEARIFAKIGLQDKAVAQLSCNNGRELISVKKAGAGLCVGFDISEKFIAQAERLTEASGEQLSFVRSNVYDIAETYNNSFDIIYVTVGALGWLPDLEAYFKVVSRLLKKDGYFFLWEMHPILDMFEAATGLTIKHSYFRTEPQCDESAPDYYDKSIIVEGASYWFHHKLSDIIGGCLRQSLELREFNEYERDISNVFAEFESFEKKPPLSYSLLAQKV